MPKRRYLTLTKEMKAELENVRDRHPKAYAREQASALLKIAEGISPRQVALHGLLKARDPDTVYSWMNRYEAEGIAGLLVKKGRGRRPAFSPSVSE